MALTDKELQELAELEELEALEAKFGTGAPAVAPVNTDPSMLKSALIGAGQGATFDFGDEALAAVQAIMSNKPYREFQQENEAAAKQAADVNPVSYYAGNIGAGIAFNPLAKGVAAGTKAVGAAAATVAPTLNTIAKAAPAIPKIAQMGAEGAVYGGLLGAGQASADDNLLSEVGEGAKTGMAIGAALGGITEIGKKVLSPITKRLNESDVFESIREQRDITKKGYDPTLRSTFDRVEDEIQDEVQNFVIGNKDIKGNSLPELRQSLGKEMGRLREEALSTIPDFKIPVNADELSDLSSSFKAVDNMGPRLDTSVKQYNSLMNKFGFVNEMGELAGRELDSREAASMASEIQRILAGEVPGYRIESPPIKLRLQDLHSMLTDPLEHEIIKSGKYPQYKEARSVFKKIADTQDRLGVEDYYYGDVGAMERDTVKMLNKVKQLANERTNTGESFRRETRMLREAVTSPGFKYLPQAVQDDLTKVVERLDKFEDLSQARAMSLDAQGRTTPDSKGLMFLMNSYRAMVMKALGVAMDLPEVARLASDEIITPQGTKALGKVSKTATNAVNIDYYFSKLSDMAKKRGNTELSKTLDYIGQQDMKKRRAMVFVLMQQPGVRELLKEDSK